MGVLQEQAAELMRIAERLGQLGDASEKEVDGWIAIGEKREAERQHAERFALEACLDSAWSRTHRGPTNGWRFTTEEPWHSIEEWMRWSSRPAGTGAPIAAAFWSSLTT